MSKPKRRVDRKLLSEVRKLPCIHCGTASAHAHHVKTRGAGGGDEIGNVMPLCVFGHMEIHRYGTIHMADRYPGVLRWLVANGWTDADGRWRRF